MKLLVIAPHYDDEALGCGGMLNRLSSSGAEIHVAVMTGKRKTKGLYDNELSNTLRRQSETVKDILGIKKYHIYNLEDEELYQDFSSVRHAIEGIRDEVCPDAILIPGIHDLNQDHVTVHEASMIAFRPATYRRSFNLLAYEVVSATDQSLIPFKPNSFFECSGMNIKAKVTAMEAYLSECYGSRDAHGIISIAKYRGIQSGYEYAEAYQLLISKGDHMK